DEDVRAAHVLLDLAEGLAVGEVEGRHPPGRQVEVVADLLYQGGMGASAEDLQFARHGSPCEDESRPAPRSGPLDCRCPWDVPPSGSIWLGREDSNLRMPD